MSVNSTEKLPLHVAIIPDGNRRWARDHGLKSFDGHLKGVQAFKDVAEHAADRGVRYLSVWGMSADNFVKRSRAEVAGLLRVFATEFRKLAVSDSIHQRQTRVRVLGQWRELFPEATKQAIEEALEATAHYDKFTLTFLLAYNGDDDMLQAVQGVVDEARVNDELQVTDKVLKRHLMSAELPAIDLLIRTAGDPHLSAGFMMWDMANAELYFTDKYWPDFSTAAFDTALADYSKRRRRRGT